MTLQDRNTITGTLLSMCQETLIKKGKDYSSESDGLANFKIIADEIQASVYTIWYAYYMKHWMAIRNYIDLRHVESESIQSRIVDAINYLALLWCIIEDQATEQREIDEARNEKRYGV